MVVRRAERRDTAANWTSVNPVLAAGEEGVELASPPQSAKPRLKVGDGVRAWVDLPYTDTTGGGGVYPPIDGIPVTDLAASLRDKIDAAAALVVPAPSQATWRPTPPTGPELVTGMTFPVSMTGNYQTPNVAIPGTGPQIIRLYFAASVPTGCEVKVFDSSGVRQFSLGQTETDYATVLDLPASGDFAVQFQLGGNTGTLNAFSVRQITAVERFIRMGGDTASPAFSGGETVLLDVPIEPTPAGGTPSRVTVGWAGENAPGESLRPAYSGHNIFPESAYASPFGRGRGSSGAGFAQMTVGNNDHVFDIATSTGSYQLRGDVHGGESTLTGNPANDWKMEYDVLGDGTWRTYLPGKAIRQATRVRVTCPTKLTVDGTVLWNFAKRWTVYADGTIRNDRTSTSQAAHKLRLWYYWMVSGDPTQRLAKAALDGTRRIASLVEGEAVAAVEYFGGNQSLMYQAATGVALAIALDRDLLLGYPLTTPGNSTTAPPPGPRILDGQLNGQLNKLYHFVQLDTASIPAGFAITSTQWQKFYKPTSVAYPERDMDPYTALPHRMVLTYPAT